MAKRSKVGRIFTSKQFISGIVMPISYGCYWSANVIVHIVDEVDPRSCFLPAFSKGHILGTDKLGRRLPIKNIMGIAKALCSMLSS